MAYGAKDAKFNTDSEKSCHIWYGSRDCVGNVQNMAFFGHVFRISLIQILLDLARVTDLYILTLFGPLYKTMGCRLCEPLCAKNQKRSKMGHAWQILTYMLFHVELHQIYICFDSEFCRKLKFKIIWGQIRSQKVIRGQTWVKLVKKDSNRAVWSTCMHYTYVPTLYNAYNWTKQPGLTSDYFLWPDLT